MSKPTGPFVIQRHCVATDVTVEEDGVYVVRWTAEQRADELSALHGPRYEFSVWQVASLEPTARGGDYDLYLVPCD